MNSNFTFILMCFKDMNKEVWEMTQRFRAHTIVAGSVPAILRLHTPASNYNFRESGLLASLDNCIQMYIPPHRYTCICKFQ